MKELTTKEKSKKSAGIWESLIDDSLEDAVSILAVALILTLRDPHRGVQNPEKVFEFFNVRCKHMFDTVDNLWGGDDSLH